jgi:glycosyltransferase involved in cell wall biosynthesis
MVTTPTTSEGAFATSVVISTYNRPQGVLDLLASLAKQTLMPEAVYVVDQSPDTAIGEAVEKARAPRHRLSLACVFSVVLWLN